MSSLRHKLGLARTFARGRPILCTWQVTYQCNFRCSFCSYWQEEVNWSSTARARESRVEDFRSGSEKLAGIGTMLVSLAGGEPLLRRDLAEIVSAVARHHLPLLTTNGWLVTEERARELWQAGLVTASVSLDFADGAQHDSARGTRGAAEKARRALRLLRDTRTQRGQRVMLACVVSDRNAEQVEELVRFARDERIAVTLQPMADVKNGTREMRAAAGVSKRLLDIARRYPNVASGHRFLAAFDGFATQRGVAGCRAGQAFFNIDNFGNIAKCVEFRAEPIGNLHELTPAQILARLGAERARNRCEACWYRCRGEVESLYSIGGLFDGVRAALRGKVLTTESR